MTEELLETANNLSGEIGRLEKELQIIDEARRRARINEVCIGNCYFLLTDEEAEAILLRTEAETNERLRELKRQFDEL